MFQQGQFLAQDDDSQFVRRRQAPRHLPPPPRLHDEYTHPLAKIREIELLVL